MTTATITYSTGPMTVPQTVSGELLSESEMHVSIKVDKGDGKIVRVHKTRVLKMTQEDRDE